MHVASPSELPTHKVWSWGNDRDAADWRTALSDDDSAYVELQAGLFRNQETYAFLEPQESVRFSEYWLPVRDLGGITRANVDGVLHMERTTATHVRLALDVTRDLPNARVKYRERRLHSTSECRCLLVTLGGGKGTPPARPRFDSTSVTKTESR